MFAFSLLITPLALDITLVVLGAVGVMVLLGFFYHFILYPAFKVMADTSSPPPALGESKELILKNGRHLRYRLGLVDSDWKLRMKGIVEDHLVFDFRKDRTLEEYEIELIPSGPVLYRPPHEQHLQRHLHSAFRRGEPVVRTYFSYRKRPIHPRIRPSLTMA